MEFDVELCAKYVEQLVCHDEVERALWVINNVPAYYRDHLPEKLKKLRSEILKARYTAATYVSSPNDANVDTATAIPRLQMLLRGRLLQSEVARYKSLGIVPHIVEMGPGTYFVPHALSQLGYEFTYHDIVLNAEAATLSGHIAQRLTEKGSQGASPRIFVAHEIIEHLADIEEIAIEAAKYCGDAGPERVHLSTPLYTYDHNHDEWRIKDGLPHLRAYTPYEFLEAAGKLFPGYNWTFYNNQIMSLVGQRADALDPTPLLT